MMFLGNLLAGLAAGGLAWVVLHILQAPRVVSPLLGRFEEDRRRKLREASPTYLWFEPWIEEMAQRIDAGAAPRMRSLQQHLLTSGELAPWKASEYLATRRVEAVGAGLSGAVLGWILGGWMGVCMFGLAFYFGYEFMMTRLVKSRAFRRQIAVRRRFAAAVDLMALMMEVGGGFQESLQVAADESRGHDLGDELSRVVKDIKLGRSRKDALQAFTQRMQDDDISELTMAVIEGEELGTPLAKILRIQADQMRQKRSQWAEKAAEESQVALVFPAMIIMVACLLTVAAPFVLNALFTDRGI